MSIFNDKALKGVAEAVSKIVEAEKMAKKDHDQDGKIETGKAEYLGSRIRAAKMAGKMKEETELDEAFPTVADAKKRMDSGKTATGSVTKTKTGLVHKRDYKDDDNDAEDTQKKSKGYGARQNFKRSTRVNEQKLSFTEMLQLYNEAGVEVISKIVPQTVKFGDTEVELIDANIVNGAVGITVAEEVDNETFTKEVEAQKEKNAGRGKKAEVAKASVQAVKQEEVELDEALQADKTVGSHTIKHTKSDSTSSYVDSDHQKSKNTFHHYDVHDGGGKKVGVFVHEVTRRPSGSKEHMFRGKLGDKTWHGEKSEHSSIHKLLKSHLGEAVEQIDEISKGTLGSYIKKASHDVAAKGAFTRHFADKSRAETAEQKHDIARKTMKKADKMQDAGMKRRANMAKAVDRLTKEDVEQIDERTLTSGETAKKEDYVKGMKKSVSGFKARYGDKAKSVMYATATKMAKKD